MTFIQYIDNSSSAISTDISKFSNTNTTIFTIIICIIILIFLIKISAFKHNKPTCNNYVINSYLYITLAALLTIGFMYLLNYIYNDFSITYDSLFPTTNNAVPLLYLLTSFIALLLLFILTYTLHFINPSNFITMHLLWVAIIMLLSIVIYPIIKIKQYSSYINLSFLSTAVIMFLMAIVIKIYPHFFNKISSWLFVVCLISLITIIVTDIINDTVIKNAHYNQYITYIGVVLFTLFIVVDTTFLYKRAQKCKIPNYPDSSMNLILDCYNLFFNFIELFNN